MAHKHNQSINELHLSRVFFLGIILNVIYVVVEIVYGLLLNSSALLSDAGHNFGDIISLLIGAIAFYLAKIKPKGNYTYGLNKITVFAPFVNSILLLIAVGAVVMHSFKRLLSPVPLDSIIIMIVASVGIFINSLSAWLFFKDRKKDINVKVVFWHLVADALVSVGVVLGAIIIKFTGAYWIDGFVGLVISVIILVSAWELLRDSFLMMIDVVPKGVDIEDIKKVLVAESEVVSVHHIHVWAISTTLLSLTVHVVVSNNYTLKELEQIKVKLKNKLAKKGILHSTIEFESQDFQCKHDYEC